MRSCGMPRSLPLCTYITLVIFSFYWISSTNEAGAKGHFAQAQALVERIVSAHPEIVRLTIHAVPDGEEHSRIIACNLKEKIGKSSDPEDLEAMKTGKTIVLKEGDNLDVTVPIYDKAGKPIAATGITLPLKKGESEEEVIERARSIARLLSSAVQDAGGPLW